MFWDWFWRLKCWVSRRWLQLASCSKGMAQSWRSIVVQTSSASSEERRVSRSTIRRVPQSIASRIVRPVLQHLGQIQRRLPMTFVNQKAKLMIWKHDRERKPKINEFENLFIEMWIGFDEVANRTQFEMPRSIYGFNDAPISRMRDVKQPITLIFSNNEENLCKVFPDLKVLRI